MSRIGKQPISVPKGVKVSQDARLVFVTGPKGNLSFEVHPDMEVKQENSHLLVERPSDNKAHRSLHGTTRAIISNMVQGVTEGFTKELEINGVIIEDKKDETNTNVFAILESDLTKSISDEQNKNFH